MFLFFALFLFDDDDAMKMTKINLLKAGNSFKMYVEEKQTPCNNISELNGTLRIFHTTAILENEA